MHATLLRQFDCYLGEGPLWDSDRLWFFDILGKGVGGPKLYRLSPDGHTAESWEGDEIASAAARTNQGGLLVATETALRHVDPDAGTAMELCALEADRPGNRCNDGRADPYGGFWIGTMGKAAEVEAGSLYRFYRGELRPLRRGLTVPNAICFSPDGRMAYFADSPTGIVYRWMLGPDGWPIGAPAVFASFDAATGLPDGAVIDEAGDMWIAVWGGSRVDRIGPDGVTHDRVMLPVAQVTCPALTPDGTLFITTAREGLSPEALAEQPLAGSVFQAEVPARGVPEPEVLLD